MSEANYGAGVGVKAMFVFLLQSSLHFVRFLMHQDKVMEKSQLEYRRYRHSASICDKC